MSPELDNLPRYLDQAREESRPGLVVLDAAVVIDEDQEAEPVLRVLLLVNDPEGDTWDREAVRQLRDQLARRAVELHLPRATVSLVPESDAPFVEQFASS